MSRTPHLAPGVHVATGRIRVDAARAVDKLRDYQLPEPTMWVLEVVRAAVLSRAERIFVLGDADDVWVSWDGPPIDAAQIARLFDELVDPAPSAARRHLRLLATGINTALGLSPRWIDIFVCDGATEASVVRYTPSLLARRDDEGRAIGLRDLTFEKRVAPPPAPKRGMLVHLRRTPWLDAVPILLGLGEAPELTVVRRACDDIEVPMTVGTSAIGRTRSHGDLLRMELGKGLDGFLAVVDPSVASMEAKVDLAELGVLLARYSLPIEGLGAAAAKIPLRLYVNAPRMPSNASRSGVRAGESPVSDALARSGELLSPLVLKLAALWSEKHKGDAIVRERLRAAALSLLAAGIAGRFWRAQVSGLASSSSAYAKAIAPLLDLPLVRDAVGRPRSLKSFAIDRGARHVHFGKTKMAQSLEPWLGEVLWIAPGDTASVLIGSWEAPSAEELIVHAKKHQKAQSAFLARKKQANVVPEAEGQLLRVPLAAPPASQQSCVPAAVFDRVPALEGEIVLYDPRVRRTSEVRLSIEGRTVETLVLDLAVPVSAAAQSAELRASENFRHAARDAAFAALLDAIRGASVLACEALAVHAKPGEKPATRSKLRAKWVKKPKGSNADVLREIVQGGLALAVSLQKGQGTPEQSAELLRRAAQEVARTKSPLLLAKIWPTLDGKHESLVSLLEQARRHRGALAYVRQSVEVSPATRRMYLLSAREIELLAPFVAIMVDYTGPLSRPQVDAATRLLRRALPARGVALTVRGEGYVAVIAWNGSAKSNIEIHHFGARLSSSEHAAAIVPCTIVIEDERAVPDEAWSTIRLAPETPYATAQWEKDLAHAIIDALAGESPPALHYGSGALNDAKDALFVAIADAPTPPAAWLGKKHLSSLRRLPLFMVLGEHALISLEDMEERFADGPIHWLQANESEGLRVDGWTPLRARPIEVAAIARLLGRELVRGDEKLAALRRVARRKAVLERHRARSPVDPSTMFLTPHVVSFSVEGLHAMAAAGETSAETGARVEVLLEGRPLMRIEAPLALPVRVVLDVPETAMDEELAALTPAARAIVDRVIDTGVRELLRHIARKEPAALLDSPRVRALFLGWGWMPGMTGAHRELADEIARAKVFASVQGPRISLHDASTAGGGVRVAVWEDEWLPPAEGESASSYDHPIVCLSRGEAKKELRELLGSLWNKGTLLDVTDEVAALWNERCVARGLVERPRLSQVLDARFRYSLEELLADEPRAKALLGTGEAALSEGRASCLQIVSRGVRHTIEANLIPRIEVAASAPSLSRARSIDEERKGELVEALAVVTARLVRRVVDATPGDQLPDWVRRSLRASCLHGEALHYERLSATPIFQTTDGRWATPSDLLAQAKRFGAVWWTADHVSTRIPLDEERMALRLMPDEAERLSGFTNVEEASNELDLDHRARANRDRPPIPSLELTPEEQSAAFSVVVLSATEADPSHGKIALLRPGSAKFRKMRVHREMRPLGALDDPSPWPTVARVEHPALVPNRTWDAPEKDAAFEKLRAKVRDAAHRELHQLLPWPVHKVAVQRVRGRQLAEDEFPKGASLEGIVWLEEEVAPGRVTFLDRLREQTIDLELPIFGSFFWDGPTLHTRIRKVWITKAYEQLLATMGSAMKADAKFHDARVAHLLHGLSLGRIARTALPPIALSCFAPAHWDLAALLSHLEAGRHVVAVEPDQVEVAIRSKIAPTFFVDDKSPIAQQLAVLIGSRRRELRDALRAGNEESRHEQGAPPKESERRAERRVSPFESRLRALIASGVLPGITELALPPRQKPLVTVSNATLEVAAKSSFVQRATEKDAIEADALARLVVARGAGVLRSKHRLDVARELAVMEALLGAQR